MAFTPAPIIVCFLATFFVLIPLPWHWRTRNIPTVASIIWLAQANFFRGVSAIIWRDNVVRHHLVYGDIVLQLQVASLWGLTAAAFCITRHLEFVSSPRYATTGLNDERNRKRFEIFMCWISPWIYCGLHLIVQGHRFDIIENIGPSITTYWSWASLWLFFLPPIMLSLGTSFYAARAFYWFFQRRAQFRDLLSSSGLSHSRYLRLMGLAVAEFLGTVSCNSYVIYVDSKTPLRPWISWQNVHSDFHRVDQYPMALLSSYWYKQYWVVWSFYPYGAFLFFVFFGFGREATLEYKKTAMWVWVNIFRQKPAAPKQHSVGQLPSFVASDSMVENSKGVIASSTHGSSGTQRYGRWDPTATFDVDSDSLYDADEHRGQRNVNLNDLESGLSVPIDGIHVARRTSSYDDDGHGVDEKKMGYEASLAPSSLNTAEREKELMEHEAPPPMPQLPHRVALSQPRRLSDDGLSSGLPSPMTPNDPQPRAF